jgi:16S rRNA (guanine527-N7)-methyltransferase
VSRSKKDERTGSGIDFRQLISDGCEKLGIVLESGAVERLFLYFEELKRWSRKINLIARDATDLMVLENHFLDSLTVLPLLGDAPFLLDIGTGGGFPGLVCHAARPDIRLTLVEPRLKRVSFLRHIARTLGLGNTEILACRIEDEEALASSTPFTHITSRAVAEIGDFLAMTARFAAHKPEIICMKGPRWRQELDAAADSIRAGALELVRTVEFTLPFSSAQRAILVLKALEKGT